MPDRPSSPAIASPETTRGTRPRKDAALDRQAPERPLRRYFIARLAAKAAAHAYSHMETEGLERLGPEPVLLCFSHQCWIDPGYLLAALPPRPRVYFFGPQEADMRQGVRNRLMRWFGLVIPFAPGARNLLAAPNRAVQRADEGGSIAIAGEGRIHSGESYLLPLKEGAAYIALRANVPVVPVAINGTGWLGFRRRIRIRFGEPLHASTARPGRPNAEEVRLLTERTQVALAELVRGFGDQPMPWAPGRWFTELFNVWPEGRRPPAPQDS